MSSHVPLDLRRLVVERANRHREHCLMDEDDTFWGCQVDHIIAEKHGGLTNEENLALACASCNRAMGSDIGSIAASTGQFTRLFNPRIDEWNEHFVLVANSIRPLTPIGEVTVKVLNVNSTERCLERRLLMELGHYPPNLV